ncbi:MAG: glycosyltransferase family 39 protein [Bacteroidia bacterium]|nr:glycosyltransferase family 39 protein [Bacteroidia bacterium]
MWWRKHPSKIAGLLILVFCIGWGLGVGDVALFDWDEVNFAECSREMRVTGEYIYAQIGFLPFWEKPPLFFWVQSVFMELAGENAWGARLPNILITGATLGILFVLGRTWHSPLFGLTWLFFHGISLLPSFYARSGLIDPLFNLFMLGSMIMGVEYLLRGTLLWGMGLGLFAGMATLTKGPVGLLLPALAVLSVGVLHRQFRRLLLLVLWAGLSYVFLVGGWVGLLAMRGTTTLLADFWAYQWRLLTTADAGHAGPWFYHLLVLLLGVFPASFWAVGALRLPWKQLDMRAQALLFLSAWTVLIFSLVKTKILHYSSLAYFGLSYLASWVWWHRRSWIIRWGWALGGIFTLLLGIVTFAAGPIMVEWSRWIEKIQDPFTREAIRTAPILWSGAEGWPGLFLIAGVGVVFLLPVRAHARLFLFGGILFVWQALTLRNFAGRAEAYSQRSLREFCSEKAATGAVVWPLGFKSYIPFFYGRLAPDRSPWVTGSFDSFQAFLLSGEAPFPVYFVSRIDRYEPFMKAHGLLLLEKRGGYVLLGLPPSGLKQANR